MVARAQAFLFAKRALHRGAGDAARLAHGRAHAAVRITQEEHDRLCARPELQSAGAAVQLLTSTAHAMGYGACWTCAPIVAGESLEQLLDVEPPSRLVALLPIGRPAELPAATSGCHWTRY